ncbi:hypothetical protein EDD18DRAFT_1110320 [Armillaria luteobubalina]|uniref:F-box domain-containing protein n=1 Tax=Armillaria luteobubalina TaxID=153913 RepID=A0AA39PQH8_9AGAR|nr:hypothetical protein EDD18DRAFT_1110320 [Armillaria luteobubalina]
MSYTSEEEQYDDTYHCQSMDRASKIQRVSVVKNRLQDIRDGREGYYVGRRQKMAGAVLTSRQGGFSMVSLVFDVLAKRFVSSEELARGDSISSALAWRPVVSPKVPIELQWCIVCAVSSIVSLKSMRLVCRSWNCEILRWTLLFHRLCFTVDDASTDSSLTRRRIEFHVGVLLSHHGIENGVTSITAYKWPLDDHCWFLHQLKAVTHVRIVECGTVTHLMIANTTVNVVGGFQNLLQQPSRLTSLVLDSVRVEGMFTNSNLDGSRLDLWRTLYRLSHGAEYGVNLGSAVLSELVVYQSNDKQVDSLEDQSSFQHTLFWLGGDIEGRLPQHIQPHETFYRGIDGRFVTTLWVHCEDGMMVDRQTWEQFGHHVTDLTVGVGASKSTPFLFVDLDDFERLKILRLDYYFTVSIAWLADSISTWMCSSKQAIWLYIHHDALWDVSAEEYREQERWEHSDYCQSWTEWWSELEDSLFPLLRRSASNGGFGGDLHIVFETHALPDSAPSVEGSTLYAGVGGARGSTLCLRFIPYQAVRFTLSARPVVTITDVKSIWASDGISLTIGTGFIYDAFFESYFKARTESQGCFVVLSSTEFMLAFFILYEFPSSFCSGMDRAGRTSGAIVQDRACMRYFSPIKIQDTSNAVATADIIKWCSGWYNAADCSVFVTSNTGRKRLC